MTGDWRDWRPAIWLAMLGVAVMLLISPFWYGAVFIGAAIGAAIRIHQRRRRLAAAASSPRVERRAGGQKARKGSGGGQSAQKGSRGGQKRRR